MTNPLEYLNTVTRKEEIILEEFYDKYFPRSSDVRLSVIVGWLDGHSAPELAVFLKKSYCTVRLYLHDADRHIKAIRRGCLE